MVTITHRGHLIDVRRQQCLAGYDLLYFTITRLADNFIVEDSFTEEDATERDYAEGLKERVDNEIADEEKFQVWLTAFYKELSHNYPAKFNVDEQLLRESDWIDEVEMREHYIDGWSITQAVDKALGVEEKPKTITVEMTVLEGWATLATAQLALFHPLFLEHPRFDDNTRHHIECVAREIQDKIAPEGRRATVANEGWKPDRLFGVLGISPRFQEPLSRYFEQHVETGGFLRAVLENDLLKAVKTADVGSYIELPRLLDYLLEHAPSNAWGDKETVAAWLKK